MMVTKVEAMGREASEWGLEMYLRRVQERNCRKLNQDPSAQSTFRRRSGTSSPGLQKYGLVSREQPGTLLLSSVPSVGVDGRWWGVR